MTDLDGTSAARRFPTRRPRAGAAGHAASSSTTPGATTTFIPDLLGVGRRRPAVGRAVARHPPQRPGHARRRPPAARRHRRRCRTCSRCSPPPSRCRCRPTRRGRRPRAGFAAGRYPDPEPKPELLLRADPVRGLCGVRARRRHARAARRARCRRAGRGRRRRRPGAARSTALYRGLAPRRARSSPPRRPATGPRRRWVTTARRPLPRRSERRRHAAAQPRRAATRARRSTSAPATSTPTSRGAGIELMGASDNVVRGGLTQAGRRRRPAAVARPDAARRAR